jgi:hypothetical protein
LAAVVAVSVLAAILSQNLDLLSTPVAADGDFAANGILILEAKRGELLVGNYSRVGFNHPGPVFLYVLALGEWLFHDMLGIAPAPYNGQWMAAVALSATLVGLAAAQCTAGMSASAASIGSVATLLMLLAAQNSGEPSTLPLGGIATPWFPLLYVPTYLLFLATCVRLGRGQAAAAPIAVGAASMLIHGHVSFVAISPIVLATATAFGGGRLIESARSAPWSLLASVIVAVAFASPIALHMATEFPGEIAAYLSYDGGTSSDFRAADLVRFLIGFWYSGGIPLWPGIVALAAFLLALPRSGRQAERRFVASALVTAAASTAATVTYVAVGVDDLQHRYVLYYYGATAWIVVIAFCAVGAALLARTTSAVGGAAAFAALGVLPHFIDLRSPYRGSEAVRSMSVEAARSELTPLYVTVSDWPIAAGLMAVALRAGGKMCIADPSWEFLFSPSAMCKDPTVTDRAPWLWISGGGGRDCCRHVLTSPLALGTPVPVRDGVEWWESIALGHGWYPPEEPWTWGDGRANVVHVRLPPELAEGSKVRFSLHVFASGRLAERRIRVSVSRGVVVEHFAAGGDLDVSVPVDESLRGRVIAVTISVSGRISPAGVGISADRRFLGAALKSVELVTDGETQ